MHTKSLNTFEYSTRCHSGEQSQWGSRSGEGERGLQSLSASVESVKASYKGKAASKNRVLRCHSNLGVWVYCVDGGADMNRQYGVGGIVFLLEF